MCLQYKEIHALHNIIKKNTIQLEKFLSLREDALSLFIILYNKGK